MRPEQHQAQHVEDRELGGDPQGPAIGAGLLVPPIQVRRVGVVAVLWGASMVVQSQVRAPPQGLPGTLLVERGIGEHVLSHRLHGSEEREFLVEVGAADPAQPLPCAADGDLGVDTEEIDERGRMLVVGMHVHDRHRHTQTRMPGAGSQRGGHLGQRVGVHVLRRMVEQFADRGEHGLRFTPVAGLSMIKLSVWGSFGLGDGERGKGGLMRPHLPEVVSLQRTGWRFPSRSEHRRRIGVLCSVRCNDADQNQDARENPATGLSRRNLCPRLVGGGASTAGFC